MILKELIDVGRKVREFDGKFSCFGCVPCLCHLELYASRATLSLADRMEQLYEHGAAVHSSSRAATAQAR